MLLADYKKHYKETLRLGGPIMLGQLGVIVVGFVDNIMVGHHGATELAAASFVNNFFALVFIFGMGFSYGLTPIIGGLFVGKEYDKAGEMLRNSLFVNFILSLLLVGIMSLLLLNIRIFILIILFSWCLWCLSCYSILISNFAMERQIR